MISKYRHSADNNRWRATVLSWFAYFVGNFSHCAFTSWHSEVLHLERLLSLLVFSILSPPTDSASPLGSRVVFSLSPLSCTPSETHLECAQEPPTHCLPCSSWRSRSSQDGPVEWSWEVGSCRGPTKGNWPGEHLTSFWLPSMAHH